ncbi:MAG: ShlB/FhaC/HecB family hemolysin secretion/activation protein, partial [Parachlamydiales bacterium]|nr:ShlB/FhaC/HecB family hemolysin secretion/activation protein [Parachlamydiales bacterium]
MKRLTFLFCFLCIFSSYANPIESSDKSRMDQIDDIFEISKKQVQEEKDFCEKNEKVILEKTKGLLLIGDILDFSKIDTSNIKGLQIQNLLLPSKFETLKTNLEFIFLNQPLTESKITQIKQSIIKFYNDNDRPVVTIFTPQQSLKNDVLILVVYESKLNDISFEKQQYFKDYRLQKYVTLKKGDVINTKDLAEDLYMMNRNPFRNTSVMLKPGDQTGTTDLVFLTDDKLPIRITAGADNTGLDSTGNGRLYTGFTWGNVFNTDQIFSYQFIISTKFQRFHAHTFSYLIPLFWKHIVNVYGGWSEIRAITNLQNSSSKGKSKQVSFRYTIPVTYRYPINHDFTFGFDYKKTDNNLLLSGVPFAGNSALITQLMTKYQLVSETKLNKTSFEIELFYSPGHLFNNQKDIDYQSLRPKAKSRYFYARAGLFPIFQLPHRFQVITNIRAQLSSENLLSSEQLGLGGYNTVRGYDERIVNKDNVILASIEARTPSLHPIKSLKIRKNIQDSLLFLGFVDFGAGKNHKNVYNIEKSQYLISIGPGLRYSIETNLNFRLDWGYQLHQLKDIAFP